MLSSYHRQCHLSLHLQHLERSQKKIAVRGVLPPLKRGTKSGPMSPMDHEQLRHYLPSSDTTYQGFNSRLWRHTGQGVADGLAFVQRTENKHFLQSRARLIGVALASLATAYLLLLCFRPVESGRQWAPFPRSLAALRSEPCLGNMRGDGNDESEHGPAEEWTQRLVQRRFGSNSSSLDRQVSQLQAPAAGTHENVINEGSVEAESSENVVGGIPSTGSLREDDLSLWEDGQLPPTEKGYVGCLFNRMHKASKLCGFLLPALSCRQRLLLASQVVMLIGVDLGAFALAKVEVVPTRGTVGDAAIHLLRQSLECSGDDTDNENLRLAVTQLIVLMTSLKEPRHFEGGNNTTKFRRKMVSILGTADIALKNCLGVLGGLLRLKREMPTRTLPLEAVQQQLNVLRSIYEIHADHIAKDCLLRAQIVECQKRTGVYALLGPQHFFLSKSKILPIKKLRNMISDAVTAAGGLLPFQRPATEELSNPRGALEGQGVRIRSWRREQDKPASKKSLQEEFAEAVRCSFDPETLLAHEAMEAESSRAVRHPLWRRGQLCQQGSGPVLQPPCAFSSSNGSHDRLPNLVSTDAFLSAVGLSVFRSRTAEQGGLSGQLHSSCLDKSSLAPFNSLATLNSSPDSAVRPSEQHAPAGRRAGVHLARFSAPPPTGVGEPSQWLQTPATLPAEGYSLFGDGGIPPWSPFSGLQAHSSERRATTSGGWPGGQ